MKIFVNEGYENYKYIVGQSDNYVILTNRHSVTADWQNPQTIDIIYQYLKPSTLTIEGERTVNSNQYYEQIVQTQDNWYRAEAPEIITSGFILLFFILFIINASTRLFRKGGIFFGRT